MAITFKSVLASGGSGATITVTYSSEFYGQTLTATNGTDTVTALATSAGTVDITVPSAGSWVVSCTISGETYTSETVSVDLSYSTELVAIPDGSTVTPTDDVQTWLKCAGIKDKAYTTLSEVLADSVTFNALLGDSNACLYMARSTTWAATLCADQYAMSMIGQYDVCCDALLGNATWESAIAGSTYVDYVLPVKVPTMSSNTSPSGEASASAIFDSTWPAWKAFGYDPITDSTNTRSWLPPGNTSNQWVQYEFPTAQVIKVWQLTSNYGDGEKTFELSASNDSAFATHVVFGELKATYDVYATIHTLCIENNTAYKYWRVTIKGETDTVHGGIRSQFYGRTAQADKIHGTTNESAYYLDNGTEVAIVDPSTLSAGTYTFGSTVAKDPSDLTADYRKQIRITPNTVEVVLRPDCAVYWWGYEGSNFEVMNTANGWSRSGMSLNSPTFNVNNISCTSSSSSNSQNVGLKTSAYGINNLYVIATGVTPSNGNYGYMILNNTKTWSSTSAIKSEYITGLTQTKYTFSCEQATANSYLFVGAGWSMACTLHAIWTD